ncbi:MAG: Na/Pi cotransporter family protein [Saprospiraceae bacterium]|nr:Na/Pi cotransporter family protein [Saprospiraceae bacterium]
MAWTEIQIWYILGGLGLFLYGIELLEDSIKSLAGRSFKTFLQHQTGNPVKAVAAGALTAGIMQSSSMVILLVMSFTGAGIIGLKNGIGMILGANLGTTITGWLVALLGFKFNLESMFLPVIAVGSFCMIFINDSKTNKIGKLLFGFGLMFMGLHFMKEGFIDFASKADLSALIGKPKILFLLFGFILAAAIRSSSAAMMIFLSSLATGSIDLFQAGYLALGADLGTTVTSILGSINGNAIRKKTGWSQFYINVITAFFTLLLMKPLFHGISLLGIHDPLVALVSFHSAFNLLGILIILPFIQNFSNLIDKYISAEKKMKSKFLPYANPKEILSSLDALESETLHFITKAADIRSHLMKSTPDSSDTEQYFDLKEHENEIFNFGTQIFQNPLSVTEADKVQYFFSCIRSATLSVKDIKDVMHNLDECRLSSNDAIYNLYQEVIKQEEKFMITLQKIISTENSTDEYIHDLNEENEKNYEYLKVKAFDTYRNNQNFDLASLLNMIREVRDSGKLLLKALHQFENHKNKKTGDLQ